MGYKEKVRGIKKSLRDKNVLTFSVGFEKNTDTLKLLEDIGGVEAVRGHDFSFAKAGKPMLYISFKRKGQKD